MRNYLSILLLAAVGAAAQTPKPAPKMVCWNGFSATTDTRKTCKGDWIEDRTGKSYPSGDGCNTSTCMDAACHFGVSTAMACAYHPLHIEAIPADNGVLSVDSDVHTYSIPSTYYSLLVSDERGRIMLCDGTEDKPADCKLDPGRTLDEAIAVLLKTMKEDRKAQDDKYEALRQFSLAALERDRAAFERIQKSLKKIHSRLTPKAVPTPK